MERNFGFIQQEWNMGQLQGIDGPELFGLSMASIRD